MQYHLMQWDAIYKTYECAHGTVSTTIPGIRAHDPYDHCTTPWND